MITAIDKNTALVLIDFQKGILKRAAAHPINEVLGKGALLVEGTARAASERGYNISFATDAMTDSKADAHENSIKNIFPRLGEVGSAADIIEKLNNRI